MGRSVYHLHRSAAAEAVSRLPTWPPCWDLVVSSAAPEALGFPVPGTRLRPLRADVDDAPPVVHVSADQASTCVDREGPTSPRRVGFCPPFQPTAHDPSLSLETSSPYLPASPRSRHPAPHANPAGRRDDEERPPSLVRSYRGRPRFPQPHPSIQERPRFPPTHRPKIMGMPRSRRSLPPRTGPSPPPVAWALRPLPLAPIRTRCSPLLLHTAAHRAQDASFSLQSKGRTSVSGASRRSTSSAAVGIRCGAKRVVALVTARKDVSSLLSLTPAPPHLCPRWLILAHPFPPGCAG
jgi:hypothetical protein